MSWRRGRLQNLIGGSPIGSKHRLDVIRDGRPEQAELTIQEAPRERIKRTPPPRVESANNPLSGVLVDELKPATARQLGLGTVNGVMVTGVEENSIAEAAGLMQGDLIVEVNRQPTPSLPAYQRIVEPLRSKDPTLLLVNRQGTFVYMPVEAE